MRQKRPEPGALSRWENEGGATTGQKRPARRGRADRVPPLKNSELVQMQVRLIALENLLIALLAQATDQQLDAVGEMAGYIAPRSGFTAHRLTVHAATQMIHLTERARRIKTMV
jgi:hypothetical protein